MTKAQYKEALKIIVDEIKRIVVLIVREGDMLEKEARGRFNSELFDRFHTIFFEPNSPLEPLFFLYVALDEYLNNEGARILGAASKRHILNEYSSLDEDVKKVTTNIESLKE